MQIRARENEHTIKKDATKLHTSTKNTVQQFEVFHDLRKLGHTFQGVCLLSFFFS